MLNRFNSILALALALVLVALMFLRVDNSQPNYQIQLGDDMTYSPAYTSFEANENFSNGRTAQEPIPGTLARGARLFHFEATPQDALRAGEQLTSPIAAGTDEGIASAKRGQAYSQVYCTPCHGGDGTGNGPVAKRGFPPPPSLLIGKSREMKDGQLFHVLTYGQNSMPQFAAQLDPESQWDVINYIRQIQSEAKPPSEQLPAEATPVEEQALLVPQKTNQISQPSSVAPLELDTESKP